MLAEPHPSDQSDNSLNLEMYKIALATRNLEINLFWQRSNYFLVLNTAVAIGYFSHGHRDKYSLMLSLLGVAIAYLWVLINLGSKFWQSRWEQRLSAVEEQLPGPIRLFSARWPEIESDVRRSFESPYPAKRIYGKWLPKLYTKAVMRKPSVSRVMTALSAMFVAFWIAAAVASGIAAF